MKDLADLAEIQAARERLDRRELECIDRARHAGATWARIAAALGMASRQAAEQRHRRLVATARTRRHECDLRYAPSIAAMRVALEQLQAWIGTDRRWSVRFARADLVRSTAVAARDAAPGSLYALVAHIAADLEMVGVERLPPPVQASYATLVASLSTID